MGCWAPGRWTLGLWVSGKRAHFKCPACQCCESQLLLPGSSFHRKTGSLPITGALFVMGMGLPSLGRPTWSLHLSGKRGGFLHRDRGGCPCPLEPRCLLRPALLGLSVSQAQISPFKLCSRSKQNLVSPVTIFSHHTSKGPENKEEGGIPRLPLMLTHGNQWPLLRCSAAPQIYRRLLPSPGTSWVVRTAAARPSGHLGSFSPPRQAPT